MKNLFLLFGAMLVILALCGCRCPFCGTKTEECKVPKGVKTLTMVELQKIVADKSALIFDARIKKYDTGERIPGAKSLPADSAVEEISKAIPDKNAAVVLYCANTKCPASANLAEILKKQGYTNIMTYHEGIEGWIKAGNKIEKEK